MNDKLKLPLTAVFSFLLGGVVFFPWGANDGIIGASKKSLDNSFVFDQAEKTNKQFTLANIEALKNKIVVKKVDYHFSGYDIALSNLAISEQLKDSKRIKNKDNDTADVISATSDSNQNKIVDDVLPQTVESDTSINTVVVDYRFSKDELKLSNLAIKNQLKNSDLLLESEIESKHSTNKIIPIEKIIEATENTIKKPIIIVKYRFSSDELNISNSQIKKQLKNYREISVTKKEKIIVKKVNYNFDSQALIISNSVIEKQLGRYLAKNIVVEDIQEDHKTNINEFEVAEKSETNLFVSDVSDYENDSVENTELDNDDKKYKKVEFSKSELELSNLAIAKQLQGYKNSIPIVTEAREALSNVDTKAEDSNELKSVVTKAEVSNSYNDEENESDLLISNSAHDDDDDEDYSNIPVKFNLKRQLRKSNLSSINEIETHGENSDEHEEDDEEDFSGERVIFNNDPQFLTHSLDEISAIDDNIEIPDVENITDESIVEDVEIIEEIEINDDGKIISSSSE
jgi:hypothetical protein